MKKINWAMILLVTAIIAIFWWLATTPNGIEIALWIFGTILALLLNFTINEDGNVKFVVASGTFFRTILAGQGIFVWLGIYWVGIRFIHSIHWFEIEKEREGAGNTPDSWIIREKEPTLVDHLLLTIPRPFSLEEVELKNGVKVNFLASTILEPVETLDNHGNTEEIGYRFVFKLKAKFTPVQAIIRAAVQDEVQKFESYLAFVSASKAEGGFLELLLQKGPGGEESAFNQKLILETGLRMRAINIPKQDLVDKSLLEAQNELAVAAIRVETAKKEAEAIKEKAEGEKYRLQELAAAPAIGILAALQSVNATSEEQIKALQELFMWGSIKDSNLTTLVQKGGGVVPTIPLS